MTHSILTADNLYVTVYATLSDFIDNEITPAIIYGVGEDFDLDGMVEKMRAGDMIVFEDGDVTIIGPVASGAEVIAGGSIHIYGALRGRERVDRCAHDLVSANPIFVFEVRQVDLFG